MPKNLTAKVVTKSETPTVVQKYRASGPLPHPALLNQYDAETRKVIVEMAYRQSRHRQSLEKTIIQNNVDGEKKGMWISTAITVLMIACGTVLILNNKEVSGFLAI